MMGEDTSGFQKKTKQTSEDVTLEYEEYKPRTRKAPAPKPAAAPPKNEESSLFLIVFVYFRIPGDQFIAL